jgi:hypothetical protein
MTTFGMSPSFTKSFWEALVDYDTIECPKTKEDLEKALEVA